MDRGVHSYTSIQASPKNSTLHISNHPNRLSWLLPLTGCAPSLVPSEKSGTGELMQDLSQHQGRRVPLPWLSTIFSHPLHLAQCLTLHRPTGCAPSPGSSEKSGTGDFMQDLSQHHRPTGCEANSKHVNQHIRPPAFV